MAGRQAGRQADSDADAGAAAAPVAAGFQLAASPSPSSSLYAHFISGTLTHCAQYKKLSATDFVACVFFCLRFVLLLLLLLLVFATAGGVSFSNNSGQSERYIRIWCLVFTNHKSVRLMKLCKAPSKWVAQVAEVKEIAYTQRLPGKVNDDCVGSSSMSEMDSQSRVDSQTAHDQCAHDDRC